MTRRNLSDGKLRGCRLKLVEKIAALKHRSYNLPLIEMKPCSEAGPQINRFCR